MSVIGPPQVRRQGRVEYLPTWQAMQAFTGERGARTRDEIWVVEHPPVFTLGLNARPEHLLAPGDISVIQTDRGGQVTYHGPGQIVVYPLLDIRRRGLSVRELVTLLEDAVVGLLADHGVTARPRPDARGVYVDGAKIAALGLRIRRGASYHGLALNVDMDLEPFDRINPCGHAGMAVTQLRNLVTAVDPEAITEGLLHHLLARLDRQASGRRSA